MIDSTFLGAAAECGVADDSGEVKCLRANIFTYLHCEIRQRTPRICHAGHHIVGQDY
jgi:hypothetical protein